MTGAISSPVLRKWYETLIIHSVRNLVDEESKEKVMQLIILEEDEEKLVRAKSMKNWLVKLRSIAYDVCDAGRSGG